MYRTRSIRFTRKKYARYVSVLNISASLSPLLSGIHGNHDVHVKSTVCVVINIYLSIAPLCVVQSIFTIFYNL